VTEWRSAAPCAITSIAAAVVPVSLVPAVSVQRKHDWRPPPDDCERTATLWALAVPHPDILISGGCAF
jgi:hypothetical protein